MPTPSGQEKEIVTWLLERGADTNARSLSKEGAGPTPLYHAVVTCRPKNEEMACVLLDHGAEPNVRADLQKQFLHMGDPEREKMQKCHHVTPLRDARRFQELWIVSEPAVIFPVERGGVEGKKASSSRENRRRLPGPSTISFKPTRRIRLSSWPTAALLETDTVALCLCYNTTARLEFWTGRLLQSHKPV